MLGRSTLPLKVCNDGAKERQGSPSWPLESYLKNPLKFCFVELSAYDTSHVFCHQQQTGEATITDRQQAKNEY